MEEGFALGEKEIPFRVSKGFTRISVDRNNSEGKIKFIEWR